MFVFKKLSVECDGNIHYLNLVKKRWFCDKGKERILIEMIEWEIINTHTHELLYAFICTKGSSQTKAKKCVCVSGRKELTFHGNRHWTNRILERMPLLQKCYNGKNTMNSWANTLQRIASQNVRTHASSAMCLG